MSLRLFSAELGCTLKDLAPAFNRVALILYKQATFVKLMKDRVRVDVRSSLLPLILAEFEQLACRREAEVIALDRGADMLFQHKRVCLQLRINASGSQL